MKLRPDPDSPQIKIPPPVGVLGLCLGLWLLNSLIPAPFISGPARWIVGSLGIGGGVALIVASALLFKRNKTHIEPWKPSSFLLRQGPYRFSRNPIYLGFMVFSCGMIVLANNYWGFLLLLP